MCNGSRAVVASIRALASSVAAQATQEYPIPAGTHLHDAAPAQDGGPYGTPWITDSGPTAIVRVDPKNDKAEVFPLSRNMPYVYLSAASANKLAATREPGR